MRRLVVIAFLVITVGLFTVPPASADTQTQLLFAFTPFGVQQLTLKAGESIVVVDAFSTGWWDSTGFHLAANTNYAAGFCSAADCAGGAELVNNFFAFDLSHVGLSLIESATLSIGNDPSGYINPNPTALYSAYDVSTPASVLTADGSGNVGVFTDLGSGKLFGTYLSSPADDGTQVEFALSADAINAINAVLQGNGNDGFNFAIGGVLQLQETPIPEPGSLVLLGSGLFVLAGAVRRRLSL